jgi:putative DNA methylase
VNSPRKKLIEVSVPLEAINVASAREKSIRHGHPSTLHLWWARRPLAACRAVLFAQLVDDPSAWPERFLTEEEQDAERRRLHKIIERLVPWDASTDEAILNEARWEIARSVAWGLGKEPPPRADSKAILDYLQTKAPPVYDPFCGGGSIPLEAQRLGLRAYGSDLNPVAVLISKALVEIPPKFAGWPPVNPIARADAVRGELRGWKGAQGLAEDVRYYGRWMRDEAEKRIGHLYPKAKLADGSEAMVIAWLWARTVRSPDPAAKGAMVPLVSSFMLSTKEGKKAWVEPIIDTTAPDGWRFDVKSGELSKAKEERLKKGTKAAPGNFTCLLTGTAISEEWNRAEGKSKRLGSRLMAIVAEKDRSRIYLAPMSSHEVLALTAKPAWKPEGELFEKALGFRVPGYGFTRWADLFTARQLVTLTTFSDLVSGARDKALADAREALTQNDPTALHAGGNGPVAYADAIATYLGLGVGRLADVQNSLCGWENTKTQVRHLFTRQAIPMLWDYGENNTFANAAGDFGVSLKNLAKALEGAPAVSPNSVIAHNAAQAFPFRNVTISSDPPYYDNVGYADLSDFFYVWLRGALSTVWPDLFRRLSTPKNEELVATPARHGGKMEADAFFMSGMGEALTCMKAAATDNEPLTIYYAFKQAEAAEDGITSAGWASFLQAVVDAGLSVDGTWPMRTELGNRIRGQSSNALASSIILVCRKGAVNAVTVTRAEFIRALKKELPDAIDDIRKASVGPVDMQQTVIGPGMGIFTRYGKVLENDDSPMSVKTALSLINRVWEEIENELDAAFDPETQVALAWFATYGFDVKSSGELIGLANAKNISDRALFGSGVFKNMHGQTALTPRAELSADWSPSADKSVTVWECVQHTARVLNAPDGGGEAAARLVAQMGPKAADARALAYRLYEISSQKGWAGEALVYNELAQEWARLEDIAINMASPTRTTTGAQGAFTFDEGAA